MCMTPATVRSALRCAFPRLATTHAVARFLLWLLTLYKRWLSPLLGTRCRFDPSCSCYARAAIARHGAARGCLLAGWRLLRCQPLCKGGSDPVPERFHLRRCGAHGE